MPISGGGLPSPVPGHDVEVGDDLGVPDLGDRLLQQIVGDGEVEQRIVGHCRGTLSLTRASGRCSRALSPGRRATVATVSGPSGQHGHPRPPDPRRPSAAATAPSRSGAGTSECVRDVCRRSRPSVCRCTSARREDPARAPGPASGRARAARPAPASSAGGRAPGQEAGEGAAGGHAVLAGGGHDDDPAVAHDPLGRRHALDRLVEVAVERVPAVGRDHEVEGRADLAHRRRLHVGAGGVVAVGQRAGEDGGHRRRPVDGDVERQVRRARAVAARTKSWTGLPARVTTRWPGRRRCGAGWWASRMVSVAASPGHTPLGPPLKPAKKWGSTKPVRMRTSASTYSRCEQDRRPVHLADRARARRSSRRGRRWRSGRRCPARPAPPSPPRWPGGASRWRTAA